MFKNNQCKTKQIKVNKSNSNNVLKKIRSKDSLRQQYTKGPSYQKQQNSKNKPTKLKQQFKISSRSKQKNRKSQIIHQQYYIKPLQKHQQDKPKIIIESKLRNAKSNSKFINFDTLEKKIKEHKKTQSDPNSQDVRFQRISLPFHRDAINFQGKWVRIENKNKNLEPDLHKNYTSLVSSNLMIEQEQLVKHKSKQKRTKITSKQKIKYSKSNPKSTHKQHKSQQDMTTHDTNQKDRKKLLTMTQQRTMHSQYQKKNNIMYQDTEISPFKQKQYQRKQKFDFQQIFQLIQQDIQTCKQVKINVQTNQIRRLSIKFMSQICGEVAVRRQTFYLAISIYDRAMSKKIIVDNFKMLSLVCLTLAMKLQQSQLSSQFIEVLGIISSDKQFYLSSTSSRQSSKHVPRNGSNHKKPKKLKIIIKQQNIRKISTSNIAKILKKYSIIKMPKSQFIELQQKVTTYLRFKLWRIQVIFWADLLTCLWDQYLISCKNKNSDMSTNDKQNQSENQNWIEQDVSLLFRCSMSLMNISYLYQLLQMAYNHQNVYNFPSIYIVLSSMYLLIRITKQRYTASSHTHIEDGYEYYRSTLANSTNILFVDKTGVNRIFWKFIGKIKVEMVQIISCCQFISQFLEPKLMKISNNNSQETKETLDNLLSIHMFNPNLYSGVN